MPSCPSLHQVIHHACCAVPQLLFCVHACRKLFVAFVTTASLLPPASADALQAAWSAAGHPTALPACDPSVAQLPLLVHSYFQRTLLEWCFATLVRQPKATQPGPLATSAAEDVEGKPQKKRHAKQPPEPSQQQQPHMEPRLWWLAAVLLQACSPPGSAAALAPASLLSVTTRACTGW